MKKGTKKKAKKVSKKVVKKQEPVEVGPVIETFSKEDGLVEEARQLETRSFDACPLSEELLSSLEFVTFAQKPQTVVLLGSLEGWDLEILARGRHQPRRVYLACTPVHVVEGLEDVFDAQVCPPHLILSDLIRHDIGIDMVIISGANSVKREMLTSLAARFEEDVVLVFIGSVDMAAQDIIRSYRNRPLWQDVEFPVPIRKDKSSELGLSVVKAPLVGSRIQAAVARVFRKGK